MRDIYYTVRDADGTEVKPITRWTFDTPGSDEGQRGSNLASLSGGRVLLTWNQLGAYDLYYAVLDSDGNVVKDSTNLVGEGTSPYDWLPDAAQLSDGRTVVAWQAGPFGGPYHMRYAVLDPDYNRIAGPTMLSNPAALDSEGGVSVAADADSHAILTWVDSGAYQGNLYYALLDGSGTQLVPPMPFLTSQAAVPKMVVNQAGYGSTSYNLVTPTTDGVDFVLEAPALASSASGGVAHLTAPSSNHGLATATGVQVTAEMDPALSFVDAWPQPSPKDAPQAEVIVLRAAFENAFDVVRLALALQVVDDAVDLVVADKGASVPVRTELGSWASNRMLASYASAAC